MTVPNPTHGFVFCLSYSLRIYVNTFFSQQHMQSDPYLVGIQRPSKILALQHGNLSPSFRLHSRLSVLGVCLGPITLEVSLGQ